MTRSYPPKRKAVSPPAAQVAAQRQADLAERRLRDAVDALPEGIVFLDPDGRYILWNQRYAEIYKRSADLFEVGARLEDTLRVGIARGDRSGCGRGRQRIARVCRHRGRHRVDVVGARGAAREDQRQQGQHRQGARAMVGIAGGAGRSP